MPFLFRSTSASLIAATILLSSAAIAKERSAPARFDPRSLGVGMAGEATRIMVLGTDHLSHMPPNYRTAFLAPLIDRLADYQPQIITIEGLSGPDCEYLERYKAIVPGLAEDYCWKAEDARHATGLDVPEATAAVEQTLRTLPSQPTGAERRHLAALFLAANDRPSAVVQWLRLPKEDRRIGDGLDATLVTLLTKVAGSANENIAIAATLAARLGLDRIYSVDDHSADSITATLGKDYEAAIQRVWSSPSPMRKVLETKETEIHDGDSLIAAYRFLNDPAVVKVAVSSDMGQAIKQQTPEQYGRRYVAWWETRNLRMVANIRSAFGNMPGARVLSIVGSTHKPYFESYLGMMADVKIVDTAPMLAQSYYAGGSSPDAGSRQQSR